MNKAELRQFYIKKRNELSEETCKEWSKAIAELFFKYFEVAVSQVTYLHFFLPIKNKKEVDTTLILNELFDKFPNVRIVLSKSNFSDCSMQFFEYSDNTTLVVNAYGIPEPEGGVLVLPEQLGIVLVPMLVGDKRGNRIGYGKGFYDRFLKECRADCKKIGLSFEAPISEIIPEHYDVTLDFCITPSMVHGFVKGG